MAVKAVLADAKVRLNSVPNLEDIFHPMEILANLLESLGSCKLSLHNNLGLTISPSPQSQIQNIIKNYK